MRLKRLSVPWAVAKKGPKFVIAPKGAHKREASLPFGVIIRDVLKAAETAKEVKTILRSGVAFVDNRICTDIHRGIGVLDTMRLGEKAYRIIMKKIPVVIEIPKSEANIKICKVTGKKILKSGKFQINLHDGRNLILPKDAYSTNDSLLIELPEQKVKEHIKFEEGALAIVLSPAHAGEIARIKSIKRGINKKLELEDLNAKKVFEAPFEGMIVVGKDKPLLVLETIK